MSTTSRVVASRQAMLLLDKEHRLSAGIDSRPNKFYRRISSDLTRVHCDICFCVLLNDVTVRGFVPTFILPARASSESSVAEEKRRALFYYMVT